jgi:hypothetical protein
MRLALWHPDVATLRRAFVEHGFVSREGMRYRGGPPRSDPRRYGESRLRRRHAARSAGLPPLARAVTRGVVRPRTVKA